MVCSGGRKWAVISQKRCLQSVLYHLPWGHGPFDKLLSPLQEACSRKLVPRTTFSTACMTAVGPKGQNIPCSSTCLEGPAVDAAQSLAASWRQRAIRNTLMGYHYVCQFPIGRAWAQPALVACIKLDLITNARAIWQEAVRTYLSQGCSCSASAGKAGSILSRLSSCACREHRTMLVAVTTTSCAVSWSASLPGAGMLQGTAQPVWPRCGDSSLQVSCLLSAARSLHACSPAKL